MSRLGSLAIFDRRGGGATLNEMVSARNIVAVARPVVAAGRCGGGGTTSPFVSIRRIALPIAMAEVKTLFTLLGQSGNMLNARTPKIDFVLLHVSHCDTPSPLLEARAYQLPGACVFVPLADFVRVRPWRNW